MKAEYPQDWDSRRRDVYKRDRYRCQNCGVEGGPYGNAELHAHHVVPKSKGGTDGLSNLNTLCRDCHHAIHHKDKLAPTARRNRYEDLDRGFDEDVVVLGVLGFLSFIFLTFTSGFGPAIVVVLGQIIVGAAYLTFMYDTDRTPRQK